MTTIEYLKREIHRAELSIRQAHRKPNTPLEEIEGLCEKLKHLQEALEAVEEHWQRVHEQRRWTAGEPLTVEQLRKMINVPVYVEDKRYPKRSAWGMVHDGFCDMQIDAYFFADYGERWVAYPCTFAHIDLEKWTAEWVDNDQGEGMMCKCFKCGYPVSYFWGKTEFCPGCGRAMTPEALAELERRCLG